AADTLWFFYDIRGRYQEGEQAYARAAAALRGDASSAEQTVMLGKVLARQGSFCNSLNFREMSRLLLQEALAFADHHDVGGEIGFCHLRLAEISFVSPANNLAAM